MIKLLRKLLIAQMSVIILTGTTMLNAAPKIVVKVNQKEVIFNTMQPQTINNLTYIPIRGVFEMMGYEVKWDQLEQTVTLTNDTQVIAIKKDSTYTIDGKAKKLNTQVKKVNNTILLPLREVGEILGSDISWNEITKTVDIATSNSASEHKKDSNEGTLQQKEAYVSPNVCIKNFMTLMDDRNQELVQLEDKFNIEQHYSELTDVQKPEFLKEYLVINTKYINELKKMSIESEFAAIKNDTITLINAYNNKMKDLLDGIDPTTLVLVDDEIKISVIEYCKMKGVDYESYYESLTNYGTLVYLY